MTEPSIYAEVPHPVSPGLTREQAFKKDLLLQVTHEWRSSEALAKTRAELAARRSELRKRVLSQRGIDGNLRFFRDMKRRRKKQKSIADDERSIAAEAMHKRILKERQRLSDPAQGIVMRTVLVVARGYKVSANELMGRTSERHIVQARYAAWYRIYVKAQKRGRRMSFPQIGEEFGRHHTTILAGIRLHCERNNLPAPPGMNEWRKGKIKT